MVADSVLLCIQLVLATLPLRCPGVAWPPAIVRQVEVACAPAIDLEPRAQPQARADLVKFAAAVARQFCP